MADLYRITEPEDPPLENGNMICKGKNIAYLLVWKSQRIASEADPRTMAAFRARTSPSVRTTSAGASSMTQVTH